MRSRGRHYAGSGRGRPHDDRMLAREHGEGRLHVGWTSGAGIVTALLALSVLRYDKRHNMQTCRTYHFSFDGLVKFMPAKHRQSYRVSSCRTSRMTVQPAAR